MGNIHEKYSQATQLSMKLFSHLSVAKHHYWSCSTIYPEGILVYVFTNISPLVRTDIIQPKNDDDVCDSLVCKMIFLKFMYQKCHSWRKRLPDSIEFETSDSVLWTVVHNTENGIIKIRRKILEGERLRRNSI